METSGEIYISVHYKSDNYLDLRLTANSSTDDWNEAIAIYEDRMKGRYLDPIVELSHDVNKNGFAIMAIICLLIECFYQFENGRNSTEGMNREKYSQFLMSIFIRFGLQLNINDAEEFYKSIRCGILHQAQTKNHSRLSSDNDSRIIYHNGKTLVVSVPKMIDLLHDYINNYTSRLRNQGENVLRENFVKKMEVICKR